MRTKHREKYNKRGRKLGHGYAETPLTVTHTSPNTTGRDAQTNTITITRCNSTPTSTSTSTGTGEHQQSVTTEVACSVGKLHVHTVDDSVQYIEHKRKTRRDEINTGCCCYKFTEFKSRNPRILFNTAEARHQRNRGPGPSRGQPKERDK